MPESPQSVQDVKQGLEQAGYLADESAALVSFLAQRLGKPVLVEGPAGVGKTELARTLAEYLYGDRDRLVRFNMGDFTDPYQVSALFGAPYANDVNQRRGLITTRLAGRPFAVIVLDEFEKAHPAN